MLLLLKSATIMTKSTNQKPKKLLKERTTTKSGKGQSRGKRGSQTAKQSKTRPPPQPRADAMIVFDAEARRLHLTGFSERKRARRMYGLAMQKVKDRTARLEHRAELRSVTQERIAESEERRHLDAQERLLLQQKQQRQQSSKSSTIKADPLFARLADDDDDDAHEETATTVVQTYEGKETQQQWGGLVVVTTSTHIPGDSDDDGDNDDGDNDEQDEEQAEHCGDGDKKIAAAVPTTKKHHADAQQEYAGNVEKYLKDLKGHMPSSSSSKKSGQRRGKHGATHMKGVGSAADFKVAQKVLARSTTAKTNKSSGAAAGKKRKNSSKR